jgi:hypothetical protein
MKALDNAKAIYDLTMNERCEEKVQVLFSNGLHKLMIDLIEELEELKNRSCDTCKSKFCSIKRILTREDEIDNNYFYCNDWENKA